MRFGLIWMMSHDNTATDFYKRIYYSPSWDHDWNYRNSNSGDVRCHHVSIVFIIGTVSITGNAMKIGKIVMITYLTGSRSGSHKHDHPASQRTSG